MTTENILIIKEYLKEIEWSFEEEIVEDKLVLNVPIEGENLKYRLLIIIRNLDIYFTISSPIKVSEERYLEIASDLNKVNTQMILGAFKYFIDIKSLDLEYFYVTFNSTITIESVEIIIRKLCEYFEKYGFELLKKTL